MRAMRAMVVIAVGVLISAGCGGGSTATPTGGQVSPAPGATAGTSASPGGQPTIGGLPSIAIPSISGGGDVGGSYTLVVEESSFAGTYVSQNSTGGCVVTSGVLQVALEGPGAGPNGMNVFVSVSAQLDQAVAGTSEFTFSVALGDVDQGGTVATYPSPSGTDGNLKAEDRGESVAVEANGTAFAVAGSGTYETMKLRLKAVCTTVGRF